MRVRLGVRLGMRECVREVRLGMRECVREVRVRKDKPIKKEEG